MLHISDFDRDRDGRPVDEFGNTFDALPHGDDAENPFYECVTPVKPEDIVIDTPLDAYGDFPPLRRSIINFRMGIIDDSAPNMLEKIIRSSLRLLDDGDAADLKAQIRATFEDGHDWLKAANQGKGTLTMKPDQERDLLDIVAESVGLSANFVRDGFDQATHFKRTQAAIEHTASVEMVM